MRTDDSLLLKEEGQAMGHWVDIYFFPDLIAQLADLDQRLTPLLHDLSDRRSDPDLLLEGVADLVGEGLHRCQLYMCERIGLGEVDLKERGNMQAKALRCGPRVGTRYLAEAIWAGANYWKHQAEWPLAGRLSDQQENTLRVFRDSGVSENEYWLVHLLYVLAPKHTALSPLADQLVLWRNAFDRETALARRRPKRRRRKRGQRLNRAPQRRPVTDFHRLDEPGGGLGERATATWSAQMESTRVDEDSTDIAWPDVSRLCFGPGDPGVYNACVRWVQSGPHGMFGYVEGYRKAAVALYEYATESHISPDYLISPLAFLWRHHVELALKDIIALGRELAGETWSYPASHRLLRLWEEAKTHILQYGSPINELANIEANLEEFERIDPGSDGFRYPVNRQGTARSMPNAPDTVNLRVLHDAMEALANFLSCVHTELSTRLDFSS